MNALTLCTNQYYGSRAKIMITQGPGLAYGVMNVTSLFWSLGQCITVWIFTLSRTRGKLPFLTTLHGRIILLDLNVSKNHYNLIWSFFIEVDRYGNGFSIISAKPHFAAEQTEIQYLPLGSLNILSKRSCLNI